MRETWEYCEIGLGNSGSLLGKMTIYAVITYFKSDGKTITTETERFETGLETKTGAGLRFHALGMVIAALGVRGWEVTHIQSGDFDGMALLKRKIEVRGGEIEA